MPSDVEVVQAKEEQRQSAKRATLSALKGKKRAQLEFTMALGEDGEEMSFLYRAIGAVEYDALLTKYPPTAEQKADGFTHNQDKFAPDLLSQVCVEPALDRQEWAEIWTSSNWNRAEVSQLFMTAANLCNQGLDITPIKAG